MKKRKRLILTCAAVLVLGVLLFPVKTYLDDGGSIVYASPLYRIKQIRKLSNVGRTITQQEGLSITVFGKEIYHKISREHLYWQTNENDENVSCFLDAEITKITEDTLVMNVINKGIGAIDSQTTVVMKKNVIGEEVLPQLQSVDKVRISYNDKRVKVEKDLNRLWLEVVFFVYPLYGAGEDHWAVTADSPISSTLCYSGEKTVELLLNDCKELYPSDMAPENIFASVKENEYVAFENLHLTSGGEVWQAFYEKVLAEEKAQVILVNYYTPGEKSQSSEEYNEECEDEYPMLFFTSLVYLPKDGFFMGSLSYQEEEVEQIVSYPYLIHLEGDVQAPQAIFSRYDRYVLTDDNTVTWEQLERQMYSSVITDNGVRFSSVYCDLIE